MTFYELKPKVQDNIIICLNIINRKLLKDDYRAKIKKIDSVFVMVKQIAKKEQVSLLEASELLKQQLKGEKNGI